MEHPTINDLPNEVLEMIFDHLNVEGLKHASAVCKRWSDLAFLGPRMNRVLLVATFPWVKDLLLSNRKYHHLELGGTEKCSAHVKELFEAFNVSSLRIVDFGLSHSLLRLILLELPNLQHLSIVSEPDQMNEMIEPLPVMRKLERLEIVYSNLESAIHWHTIAPSLQALKMFCDTEGQLEHWRVLSGQLKQVYVTCTEINSLNCFCGITFPLLEELSIKSELSFNRYKHDLFQRHKFFRRNSSLRLLRLDGFQLSKTLVQDITNNSKKLTSLEIIGLDNEHGSNCELGALESLGQLSELKHLRLEQFDIYIFRGCKALTSLQSLCINDITFRRKGTYGFLTDLYKIAPQLRCLELGCVALTEKAVHFICYNFTKLTRLQLAYSKDVSGDCFSQIDVLPHLWYLELKLIATYEDFIYIIPQNKVRCLTLHLGEEYDEDDLLMLPEKFRQLDQLNLISRGEWLRESTEDRIRKLLPTCAIKIYINSAGSIYINGRKLRSEMMSVWEKEWVWKKPRI